MIEEATGTRLYESKKEAAQRTIEKKDAKLREIDTVCLKFYPLLLLKADCHLFHFHIKFLKILFLDLFLACDLRIKEFMSLLGMGVMLLRKSCRL